MSAPPPASASSRAARKLGDLLASIEVNDNWSEVEGTARTLANELRNRGGVVDEHTTLGKTLLPQTLTLLLKTALEGPRIPEGGRAAAVLELLRVGANLCMDHNDNRGYLLDAGFPQLVVSLLEGYAETLPAVPLPQPHLLSVPHLRIMKTAIGALLNLSLGFAPVQTRLISLEAPVTLLRISISVYPPASWQTAGEGDGSPVESESWEMRKGITEWAWRAISGLKDNEAQQPLFGAESLPSLIVPLGAFVPPFPPASGTIYADVKTRNSFFACDVEVLEEVCELLETLTMDIEDVRLALARGMALSEEPPCLERMLDFVEGAEYAPGWSGPGVPPEDLARWKQTVDLCKTAVIKAVVETSGEENNLDILWDLSASTKGFVPRMVKWLRESKDAGPQGVRDDLVICATLSLGNLVRREEHSVSFVKGPVSIASYLVTHLTPSTDLKVKHGVIGLLKHLSQSPSNRPQLGEARILESLRSCQIFSEKADIAEIVQMSAINLTKHLCTNNVANSITCVLELDESQPSSCLAQVLALAKRSDSVPVKSEGARVLVNVIKSLCSSTGDVQDIRRQLAIQATMTVESANTLAQLLGRSKKHIILLNESIMAMLLLAHQDKGAVLVLDAILAELPKETNPPSRQNSLIMPVSGSNPASPVVGPSTALDMLVIILDNFDKKFPAELRNNLCTLLGELGKESIKTEGGGRDREVQKLRGATTHALEMTQNTPDSLVLSAAARGALEAWQS